MLAEKAGRRILKHMDAGPEMNWDRCFARDWLASRFSNGRLRIQRDNVLITTGAQQALDLIGRILLEDGDRLRLNLTNARPERIDFRSKIKKG